MPNPKRAASNTPNGWLCSWNTRKRCASKSGSKRRARAAKLRHAACVEDVDYRAIRGLDRALFLKLAAGDWIRERHNLLVTGSCGVGKSWLACALGHKACRDDFSVAYHRVPRLFAALALGRADGRYTKMLRCYRSSRSAHSG